MNAGGAVPSGSDAAHMPMTGCALSWLAWLRFIERSHRHRQRAIGLRRKKEVVVSCRHSATTPNRHPGAAGAEKSTWTRLEGRVARCRHENVLLDVAALG